MLPDLAFDGQGRVAQQIGRMVGEHDWHALKFVPLPAEILHPGFLRQAQQPVDRGVAQRDDDLGFYDVELRAQERQRKGDLLWRRLAVAPLGRHFGAPFHHVADVNLLARQTHYLNDFGFG